MNTESPWLADIAADLERMLADDTAAKLLKELPRRIAEALVKAGGTYPDGTPRIDASRGQP